MWKPLVDLAALRCFNVTITGGTKPKSLRGRVFSFETCISTYLRFFLKLFTMRTPYSFTNFSHMGDLYQPRKKWASMSKIRQQDYVPKVLTGYYTPVEDPLSV